MLPRFLSEIFHGVWAMHKPSADGYMPLVASIYKGDFQKNNFDFNKGGKVTGQQFLSWSIPEEDLDEDEKDEFEFSVVENEPLSDNTISILNIIGPIVKYDLPCGAAIGTKTLEELLECADENPNVKGHIIYIDSPGGEGYAALSLARCIKKLTKPTVAFIDDMAASGGYAIASACKYIVANSVIARVGSIGTYVTFADYSKMFEMNGIFVKDVYATKSTEKNIESREAEKGNFKPLIQSIDRFNEEFLAEIKANRGINLGNENVWGTGKLFFADESFAVGAGLIDNISTFEDTFQSFVKSLTQ